MANYYTLAAFTVEFNSLEDAEAFSGVLLDVATLLDDEKEHVDPNAPLYQCVKDMVSALLNEDCQYLGFDFDVSNFHVIFSAEESMNIEAVIAVLKIAARQWNLQPIGFEWANVCSKNRVDSFGGGAAYITQDETRVLSTYQWLSDQDSK